MIPRFGDLELVETRALPNGAATVYGAGIEVGYGTPDDFTLDTEFKISAPLLTVSELANSSTMKYSLVTAFTSDFADPVVLLPDVITQTGASGAGAAAATWQGRAPIGGMRKYVGLKIVNSNSGNPSAKTATLEVLA